MEDSFARIYKMCFFTFFMALFFTIFLFVLIVELWKFNLILSCVEYVPNSGDFCRKAFSFLTSFQLAFKY